MARESQERPLTDSVFGVVVVDRSHDMQLLRQLRVDLDVAVRHGVEVTDDWEQAPFVAGRRLAGALAGTAPFAGAMAAIAIGERAIFVDPAAVTALRMSVLYGTNFQHGLMLARSVHPRRIVLVAYSAPTAQWIGPTHHDVYFAYPPTPQTIAATRVELDAAVEDGVRIDAVLIDDPTRVEDYSWTGRLQEIYELAADATSRSHGLLAHIETPVSDEAIADIVDAITNTRQ